MLLILLIMFRSRNYQVASMSILECNKTVLPLLEWSIFKTELIEDATAPGGILEKLNEVQINESIPTYRSALIDIPPNTLDYGLYKMFFKLEIDTGVPELPLYKKAFTYFNLTRSPLIPGFIKGSVSKVTRGWGQGVNLNGKEFSTDPDFPEDKNFNYTWFCRRVDPDPEEWVNTFEADSNYDGALEIFPEYKPNLAQRIPRPGEPAILLPGPGCFGFGPGGILHSAAKLNLNTSSFVTYAQVYEITLIVSKDVRISQTNIKVDVGVIPAPVVEIDCANDGLCTPTVGGIFVNPTARLAFRSGCVKDCEGGELTYKWDIKLDPLKYPFQLETVTCDMDLTTTTEKVETTTSDDRTTTLPPVVDTVLATFIDSETNKTYTGTVTSTGSIIVTYEIEGSAPATSRRRKREIYEDRPYYTGPQVTIFLV